MSNNMANPALGLDVTRLRSLLFEIIGENTFMQLRLPNDPPFSHLRHSRTLLLRLKWTLEALYIAHRHSALVSIAVPLGHDPDALRVILFLLETCSFEDVNDPTPADYLMWRYLALDVITTAIAIRLLSKPEIRLDEEDIVVNGLRKLCAVWDKSLTLNPMERALLEDIIPDSLTLTLHDTLRLQHISRDTEIEDIVNTITSTITASLDSFWQLHAVVSELIGTLYLATNRNVDIAIDHTIALRIISIADDKPTKDGDNAHAAALIQFQMERLSLAAGGLQQQWPEQTTSLTRRLIIRQLMLDLPVARRLRRVFKNEMEDFRRFVTVPKDDVVRRWVEDGSSIRSPLTIRSDDNHPPSSVTSHGTPLESRNSLASVPKNLDTTLSIDPLRFKQRESRGSQDRKGRYSDSGEVFIDVKPELKFSPVTGLEDHRSPPAPSQTHMQISSSVFSGVSNFPQQSPPASLKTSLARKPLPKTPDPAMNLSPLMTRDYGISSVSPWDSRLSAMQPVQASNEVHPSDTTSFLQQPAGYHTELPLQNLSSRDILPSADDTSNISPGSFASGRHSIREFGRQLPVSTFTPSSKIPQIPEQAPNEDIYQNTPASTIDQNHYHANLEPNWPPIRRVGTGIGGLEVSHASPPLQPDSLPILAHSPPIVEQEMKGRTRETLRNTINVVEAPPNSWQGRPRTPVSTATGSVASRKKSSLFSIFARATNTSSSNLSAQSLDFRFSPCSKHLILWRKKEPRDLVRIDYPFRSGNRFDFTISPSVRLPGGKLPRRSIRHLACSGNAIFAIAHVEDSRWIYHLETDVFRPLIHLDETIPAVLALTVSPDGLLVALGCGKCTYVYKVIDIEVEQTWRLSQREENSSPVVRVQKLNFSIDSKRLVSCVQIEQDSHRHNAYISTWTIHGARVELEAQMSPISLTVGYAGDTGITSVHIVDPSNLNASQIFLTARLSKSYPSILYMATGAKNKHLDLPDIRITSATQCQTPSSSHMFTLTSGRNKVFRVDARMGTIELVANFDAERKNVHHQHDFITLSMQGPDQIYAMWRTMDEKLVVKLCALVSSKWAITSLAVDRVYRQILDVAYV